MAATLHAMRPTCQTTGGGRRDVVHRSHRYTADALRLWVLWLTIAMLAAPLILLVFRSSRRARLVMLSANVGAALAMQWLYAQVGFVRLPGLAHIVFWVLFVWLLPKLRAAWPVVPRVTLAVFPLTIAVSLVFDVADVLRYAAGDRASLVP